MSRREHQDRPNWRRYLLPDFTDHDIITREIVVSVTFLFLGGFLAIAGVALANIPQLRLIGALLAVVGVGFVVLSIVLGAMLVGSFSKYVWETNVFS